MSSKPVDTAIVMVVGPCIDNTDFKSLEEAIAWNAAGMDVSLIVEKTDGTTAVTAITLTTGGTSDWTHTDGGYYSVEITAAQNTEEGVGFTRGICDGVLTFESPRYDIVKANVYDSLAKGTDKLQVDITQIGGVTQSGTDLKHFADSGYDPGTSKITGCKVNDDMVAAAPTVGQIRAEMEGAGTKLTLTLGDTDELQGNQGNWTTAVGFSTHNAADVKTAIEAAGSKITLILEDTADMQPNQGDWATAVGFSTHNAADVKTAMEAAGSKLTLTLEDTAELQGNQGNWTTAVGFSTHNAAAIWSVATRILTANTNFNDLDAAAIKAEVVAALQDIKLDHLLNIAVDTDWATTVHLDSVLGHIADVGTSATFDRTNDALEAIRNRGDNSWITATGFSVPNEYDTQMGYIPSNLGDVPTDSELDSAHGSGSWESAIPPTVAAIADGVWEKDLSECNTVNTAGKIMKQIKSVVSAILGLIS